MVKEDTISNVIIADKGTGTGTNPSSILGAWTKKPSNQQLKHLCAHCSEPCPDETLHLDSGEFFCCTGCKTVFEILSDNGLCKFYEIDALAGQKIKSAKGEADYAWLDDVSTATKLLEYQDDTTASVSFYLPQIHCASCIWLLENLYRLDVGVQSSRVDFLRKTISLRFEKSKTSLRKLAGLLATLGYPPEINLADVTNETKSSTDKSLMYKLGVAGFVFGNTMLLSFPEYLGLDGMASEMWFAKAFGYINLALSLPVLFYSSQDFLRSAYFGLRMNQLNIDLPLSLGIVALFGRSAYEILTHTGAGYLDSFAGLIFFLLLGRWFQQKTYHHLSFERDYKSYFPVAATVVRGETSESVPVSKLEAGDRIHVRHGELVPCDGILLRGQARMDYSFVTGEADPTQVGIGEKIFAGGRQVGERIEISVTKRVDQSYLTRLWNEDNYAKNTTGRVQLFAEKAGKWFTGVVLGVGFASMAYWLIRGEVATAINAFSAVLIIACPCAVALSIPFTLGNVMRIFGRNGFFLKNTQAIEKLAGANAVVLDKTGTLTQTEEHSVRFVSVEGGELSVDEKIAIRSLAHQSSHPRSRQISLFFSAEKVENVTAFKEHLGLGLEGKVANQHLRLGSSTFLQPTGNGENTGVFVEINGVIRGYFDLLSRYREEVPAVLEAFAQGRKLFLLSGDNDSEAAKLRELCPSKLQLEMHFRQSPQDKLEFVHHLQEAGHSVLMVGDGLNDAGALRQSDMGISISEDTNNFTPASDGILHAGEFARIPLFLQFAQKGVQTVRWGFTLAAAYNIVGLSYATTGTLSPVVAAILMPLSSVTIVLFGMGMSYFWAWKLGLLKDL